MDRAPRPAAGSRRWKAYGCSSRLRLPVRESMQAARVTRKGSSRRSGAGPDADCRRRRHLGDEPDSLAIAVQCADVDISLSGFDADRGTTSGEVRIDKRADVFVLTISLQPESPELGKDMPRHLERTPNPVRTRVLLLDLNLTHPILVIKHHRVKEFRMLHWKQEERKSVVRQFGQRSLGKPHCIWQADDYWVISCDQRVRVEHGVAKPRRARLDNVSYRGVGIPGAEILHNVRLARGD